MPLIFKISNIIIIYLSSNNKDAEHSLNIKAAANGRNTCCSSFVKLPGPVQNGRGPQRFRDRQYGAERQVAAREELE